MTKNKQGMWTCLTKKVYLYFSIMPFLSLLLSLPAHAQQHRDILVCLGQEELFFHENKITGPLYNLNQIFINELSAIKNVRVTEIDLDTICQSGRGNVSLSLLMSLLLQREKLFSIKKENDETEHFFEMRKNTIQVLLDDSPHIFFRYIAELQSQTPYPHCLTTKIPELKYFIEQLKYLEGDIPIGDLMKDKLQIRSIFSKLKKYQQIYQECLVLQKELDQKRSRKTAP